MSIFLQVNSDFFNIKELEGNMFIVMLIVNIVLGALILRGLLFLAFRTPMLLKKMEGNVGPVAKEYTERFIQGIKQKIPMAGMVLKGELEENLKGEAHREILKSVKEFEQSLAFPSLVGGGVVGFFLTFVTLIF